MAHSLLFSENSKYKDVRLFLILIPFINVVNYYLTYENFSSYWRLLATFSIDTLQGYIAWLIVRSIILWLDDRFPFELQPGKRVIMQLILTLLAGISSIILSTEFLNWLTTATPVPVSFYTKDIFIISIWFFVVNGIYVGLHYYYQFQDLEELRKKENKIITGGFMVSVSKKDVLLSYDEIIGFYFEGEYSVVVSIEKKKILIDLSLDKVEKTLPSFLFFRLNRQYIVHRQFIRGFEKLENGKITVSLKNSAPLPSPIPVSRTKAPAFKLWFATS